MSTKNRKNVWGMQRDTAPSGINMLNQGWYHVTFTDAVPVREEQGVEVTNWSSVHVIFYGDPDSDENAYVRVRPWRYYSTAPEGTGAGIEGRWIPDYERIVPVDPAQCSPTRSAHHLWRTRGAKKMFWQVVSLTQDDTEESLEWLHVVPYGFIREDEKHVITGEPEVDGALDVIAESYSTSGFVGTIAGAVCTHDGVPANNTGMKQAGRARDSQAAAVSDEDGCVLRVLSMRGESILRSHNYIGEYDRQQETDPLDSKNYGDELADVTGQGNGTYDYYFDMAGFKHFTVHWLANTVGANPGVNTLTFWATAQDDNTLPAACTYYDITNNWFGAPNFTAINYFEYDTENSTKYVRVRVVRTADGGNTDGAWTIWLRRNY